jgi:phosphohistidine phosphatase
MTGLRATTFYDLECNKWLPADPVYSHYMKVLIFRHGKAEDRAGLLSLRRDAARKLTDAGRRDTRKAATGMYRIAPAITVLATSPLTRARETAEIVAKVFDGIAPVELEALSPGGPAGAVIEWLATQPQDATVAVVGHEPDLGQLAGLLLTGREQSFLLLKKAGACLIEFDDKVKAGAGRLAWHLLPSQLRRLAK